MLPRTYASIKLLCIVVTAHTVHHPGIAALSASQALKKGLLGSTSELATRSHPVIPRGKWLREFLPDRLLREALETLRASAWGINYSGPKVIPSHPQCTANNLKAIYTIMRITIIHILC